MPTFSGFLFILVLSSLKQVNAFASLTMSTELAFSTTKASPIKAKYVLYDVPVSNSGARCRIVLYKKAISEVDIVSPMTIGGLASEAYSAINPEKKMPSLICPDTGFTLFESDTICRYFLSKYASQGPSFQPDNPKSNLIARIHDIYMMTIQSCMYRPPPFGPFGTRKDALQEYQKQLRIINDLIEESCLYLCGDEVSLADATLFPSLVFANRLLPKYDIQPFPPKLEKYFHRVQNEDPVFAKVHDEIMGGIESWEQNNRWATLLGAGWRDTAPPTLFDKIVAGEIPAEIVLQDDKVLAFKDIHPAAPAHVLVIPKNRNALTRLTKATSEHADILGRLLVVAAQVAKDESSGFGDGARIVINDGPDGGQEIMHLHVHVLGGRQMLWPPG